jgi:hypothetical protein
MHHLDQKSLAERWLISPRTLEQWRWQGRGPRYLKICRRVVYRLSDIEAFRGGQSSRQHIRSYQRADRGWALRWHSLRRLQPARHSKRISIRVLASITPNAYRCRPLEGVSSADEAVARLSQDQDPPQLYG